jgi:type III secretory pathway component EscS
MIKDWVGLGFSGLLLVVALIESRIQDYTLAFPVVFYAVLLTLCLTGVYWWIPAYIPAAEQNTAISYLFNSVTFSLLLANQLSPSLRPGYSYTSALTAGRKR